MAFALRDYQEGLIGKARQAMRDGARSILMVAPTGAGKTALAAYMLGTASARGNLCWFNVHRRELITQSSRTFEKVGIQHGIIAADFTPSPRAAVQINSIPTIARRLDRLKPPRMIVWDECHHIAAGNWAAIFSAYPDAIHIGLSATPCRLDGRGLGDWFETMVEGPTVRWLIQNGYLARYRLFSPPPPDMGGVKMRAGDFATEATAEKMDKPSITGDAIAHYAKLCGGAQAIVFCVNVAHSQHVAETFRAAGYSAMHLDGTTDSTVRDRALRDFAAGRTQVLTNCDLFGEGFDVPGIVAVIDLAPSNSLSRVLQRWGRALRPADGKEFAYLLDHAGNALRHGLPDEEREWSLDTKEKISRKNDDQEEIAKVKTCEKCFFTGELFMICPSCGHVEAPQLRQIEQRDGELIELSEEMLKRDRKREQSSAKTLDDLISLAASRGYKSPRKWAEHVYNGRRQKFG